MSLLDSHRSTVKRETDKATRLQSTIAGYQRDKVRKQNELGRTKQASRIQALGRDNQRLDEKIAKAQNDLAAAQKKAADYSEKVIKGEQKVQDDAEKARKKALQDQQRSQRAMQRRIDGTTA